MKILLTGGHGMVGRNILEHPMARMFEIHSPGRSELDLRDKNSVHKYLKLVAPDLIIHAAGRVGGISANISYPYEFLLENLEISTNIISSAEEIGVPRFINLASSCIYPKDINGSLTEDMILSGSLESTNEGYALAKIAALRLCEFVGNRSNQLNYKTLIPCNLYGPYDKFDLVSAHLVPAIIAKVFNAKNIGVNSVEIWGDGTARREFMYVEDLALAVLSVVHDYDKLPSVLNIGLGHDHTVLDYYRAVAKVIGWHGDFTFDLSKPVGMKRKLLNVDRQTTWGFKPNHSLEMGIKKTFDFYKSTVIK